MSRAQHRPLPALAALALLAACAAPRPTVPPVSAACHAGPDGGPPPTTLADGDRGIGGTGVNGTGTEAAPPAILASAEGDRGIGGTGISRTEINSTGIGNTRTGIVGVVTGFGSICVNGLHVDYDPAQPIAFMDGPAPPAALRVGQVVIVEAEGQDTALRARRIAVRHELAGSVEAVEDGALRIAGQRVATAGALPANRRWRVGEAVLVSGLRSPDGTLIATRIDPRAPDAPSLVLGRLSRPDTPAGRTRIGNLPLLVRPGLVLPPDGPVIARGRIENGLLLADEVEADRLMRDPPAYLGTPRVLMEAEIGFGDGLLLLGPALAIPGRPGPLAPGRHVLELHGGPGRALSVSGANPIPAGTQPFGERAPMPGRRFETRRNMERGPSAWFPNAHQAGGRPGHR
ncbi:hypothetical protein D9599_04015 [Roseomonas sp. KE2513]|uniref:DUF5666 domain-containing protein n=1 Tax=Roseomonas sp. KE2513 TaxID=2479202 RepID=UPI0018DFD912|nr:DUF5666 domain-containing protein [Roseomonas sp. KE2513]MBI0534735.1 hypothetical protein [Roseomonas sp. KE2513]